MSARGAGRGGPRGGPLAALLLAAAAACGGGEESGAEVGAAGARPEPAPPGAVLVVGGLPVTHAELARATERIRLVHPAQSERWARRAALATFLIPRAAVAARYAGERERARAACVAAAEAESAEALSEGARGAAPDATPAGGPPPGRTWRGALEGGWLVLGLLPWDAARRLEVGAWSACLEDVGAFVRVRLDAPPAEAELAAEQALSVTLERFPYGPPELDAAGLDALLRETPIEVLDPAVRRDVPERLLYSMPGPGGRASGAEGGGR